jgi:hypothetical protein
MAIRPKKLPRDPMQRAKAIVDLATGSAPTNVTDESKRPGGLNGGRARARALAPGQRAEIARAAATARWKKAKG